MKNKKPRIPTPDLNTKSYKLNFNKIVLIIITVVVLLTFLTPTIFTLLR